MTPLILVLSVFCLVGYSHCECPQSVIESGVYEYEANEIIQVINLLRQGTEAGKYGQPAARQLKPIIYDPLLAKQAQDFVETCDIDDVDDTTLSVALQLSTNIATEAPEFPKIINVWFNEKSSFSYPNHIFGPTVADYLRIVHEDAIAVGCGFIHYIDESNQDAKLYACKYELPEDFYGNAPYQLAGEFDSGETNVGKIEPRAET